MVSLNSVLQVGHVQNVSVTAAVGLVPGVLDLALAGPAERERRNCSKCFLKAHWLHYCVGLEDSLH